MVKLGDICKFQSGGTQSKSKPDFFGGNIPWITTVALNGGIIDSTNAVDWITDQAIRESAAKIVPQNSIMVGTRVGIGKAAINAVPMSTSQDIISLLDIDTASWDKGFLCKFIIGKNDFLLAQARGATIQGIKIDALSNLQVPDIPLEEQRHIAALLDKVSDLITKRRAQLDKLDLLVKARFVEMFGDPSSNPMGWQLTTVGQECYYIKDGPHKSLPDVGKGNGYPFISVRNIVNGYIDFSTAKYISEQDYYESVKKCSPKKGDILYSKGGTTGIAKLIDVDIKFANWVHLAVLKFDNSLNGIFFESMLNSDYCYDQSQKLTKGIANKDLVLSAMAQIKIYKPPIKLQNQFAIFVEQTNKLKWSIQQSLDKLEVLKKVLMQQYFG